MDDKKPEIMHELISLEVGEDAMPVCIKCLQPCDSKSNYCPFCGYDKFETYYLPFGINRSKRMAVLGDAFGKAWEILRDKKAKWWKRLLCVPFILLFFYPFFLILSIASLFQIGKQKEINQDNQ